MKPRPQQLQWVLDCYKMLTHTHKHSVSYPTAFLQPLSTFYLLLVENENFHNILHTF